MMLTHGKWELHPMQIRRVLGMRQVVTETRMAQKPKTGGWFLSVPHPMRKIPQPQVELSRQLHRRRSCPGPGLIRRKICSMASWSWPESLRKPSHLSQKLPSIYHRLSLPRWERVKTGKKRICRSPTGFAQSMCRTKKAVGHWKVPMSLRQNWKRDMSWQKAWMRWWWKCLWRGTRQRWSMMDGMFYV